MKKNCSLLLFFLIFTKSRAMELDNISEKEEVTFELDTQKHACIPTEQSMIPEKPTVICRENRSSTMPHCFYCSKRNHFNRLRRFAADSAS